MQQVPDDGSRGMCELADNTLVMLRSPTKRPPVTAERGPTLDHVVHCCFVDRGTHLIRLLHHNPDSFDHDRPANAEDSDHGLGVPRPATRASWKVRLSGHAGASQQHRMRFDFHAFRMTTRSRDDDCLDARPPRISMHKGVVRSRRNAEDVQGRPF